MKSRLRRWKWKHEAEVSHHFLMLTLLTTLNALNPLLEMLKCSLLLIHAILKTLKSWDEANLIMIHAILHGVESSITDYCKLLHASVERANLSRQIHPRRMIKSVRCLMRWCLYVRRLSKRWLRRWSHCVSRLRHHRLREYGLKVNTLRLEWRNVKLGFSMLKASLRVYSTLHLSYLSFLIYSRMHLFLSPGLC